MKEIKIDDVFIRFVPLPNTIKGCTIPNDDDTFDIYINSSLDEVELKKALKHELKHIKKDHFYTFDSIEMVEAEASI